jgi:hypothetical protein
MRPFSLIHCVVAALLAATAAAPAPPAAAQPAFQGLGQFPGYFQQEVTGISADGSIVVGFAGTNALQTRATIWDQQHAMRFLQDVLRDDYNLNLPGWTLTWAYRISDDGTTILGTGINPAGQNEGWVVTLPDPSAGALAVFLAFALGSRARPTAGARRPDRR